MAEKDLLNHEGHEVSRRFYWLKSTATPEFLRGYSFAPPALVVLFSFHPRLAPWAAFLRRFAAGFRPAAGRKQRLPEGL